MTNFKPKLSLIDDTGKEYNVIYTIPDFNLYKDETFCIDLYSEYDYVDIRDNATYTLIIE